MSTVLVVDDRSINRKFIAVLLGYAGHTVLEAEDGSAALTAVHCSRPDLVITDLKMPVMDGLELTTRLHADPSTSDIPVVFYSAGYRELEARQVAAACGVAFVLPKPSEPKAILDAVARIFGKRSSRVERDGDASVDAAAGRPARTQMSARRRSQRVPARDGRIARRRSEPLHRLDTRGEPLIKFHALSMRTAALLELGLSLCAQSEAQPMLDLFCLAAQDIIGARCVGVVVADLERDGALDWSASGLDDAARAALGTVDLAGGFMGQVMRGNTAVRWRALDQEPTPIGLPASHPPVAELLAVPMRSPSGRIRGLLYCADKRGGAAFDADDTQFATTLASQFALSYGNLRLFESARRNAAALEIEVADRRRAEAALRESNEKFNQLVDNISDGFWICSPDMRDLEYISPAFERIWGRSTTSLYAGSDWSEFVHGQDRARVKRAFALFAANGPALDTEYRIVQPGGTVRWLRVRGFHVRDASGEIIRLAGIATDITERREQHERVVRLSRIHAVISGISSAMLRLHDRDELLREACRVAATDGVFPLAWVSTIAAQTQQAEIVASFAYTEGIEIIAGLNQSTVWPVADRPSYRVAQTARPCIINDLETSWTMAPVRADLLRLDCRACAAFPLSIDSKVVAVLVLLARERGFFDAEEIKLLDWLAADLSFALDAIQKARRLDYLALHDTLTGLPNASLFSDRLENLICAAARDGCPVCVVVVDLEHFTRVNDTFGRSVGDELLRQVGRRFSQFLVEPYALARISADTFAVASQRDSEFIATRLRDRMRDALEEPFDILGHAISVSMQAGIALFPSDGHDGKEVFQNAEAALKVARSAGEPFAYHCSETSARIAARLVLEAQLREAIDAQQLVLHYQPRVDMISGEVVGAEALLRWQHPDEGLLAPARFIGLAEETGLIVAIGGWVIQTVCAQQAAAIAANLRTVPIAVNVSSVQLRKKDDLLRTVRDALAAHNIEGTWLDLELTESVVMNDPVSAGTTLKALRKLGVGLALDDFGTGYSSLAHLKHFPFCSVKIDRSFIADITRNAEDAAIAVAVIAMAHSMNLKVVAEGVETAGQFNYLRTHGCDEMQGFFFSRAVTKDAFESDLRSGRCMQLPARAPADRRTLLVVDDEPGICSALSRMLRRDGYRILTAASGADALDLLAVHAVQVIISDQRMPGMSGTEFLNTVKQLYPQTVRIILSGYTDLAVVTESVNRGAVFKFLLKPWDDDLLRAEVRDAFRRYQPAAIRFEGAA